MPFFSGLNRMQTHKVSIYACVRFGPLKFNDLDTSWITTILHNSSVTPSWIRSISCKTWTLLGHCICTSISKTCALCISKAGALLVHVECTSLGNSWELPCLLLCREGHFEHDRAKRPPKRLQFERELILR